MDDHYAQGILFLFLREYERQGFIRKIYHDDQLPHQERIQKLNHLADATYIACREFSRSFELQTIYAKHFRNIKQEYRGSNYYADSLKQKLESHYANILKNYLSALIKTKVIEWHNKDVREHEEMFKSSFESTMDLFCNSKCFDDVVYHYLRRMPSFGELFYTLMDTDISMVHKITEEMQYLILVAVEDTINTSIGIPSIGYMNSDKEYGDHPALFWTTIDECYTMAMTFLSNSVETKIFKNGQLYRCTISNYDHVSIEAMCRIIVQYSMLENKF